MKDCQAIIRDIRENYGNLLSISQVAQVFNCERHAATRYVKHIPYLIVGRRKKYLASDIGRFIANSMMQRNE
jgi:hypothetical protein